MAQDGWYQIIGATTTLTETQRQVGIAFWHNPGGNSPGGIWDNLGYYDSVGFQGTATVSATGTRQSFADEIHNLLQDVADGVISDFGGAAFNSDYHNDVNTSETNTIAFTTTELRIRRVGSDLISGASPDNDDGPVGVTICMHEKLWRALGWEPGFQNGDSAPENNKQAWQFRKLDPGDSFLMDLSTQGVSEQVPASGFWSGDFTTNTLGADFSDIDASDNDGSPRVYKSWHSSGTGLIILDPDEDAQTLYLAESFPYIEPDVQLPLHGQDAARLWVLRGKRALGTVDEDGQIYDQHGNKVDELESVDEYQVIETSWDFSGTAYGSMAAPATYPEMTIRHWRIPRRYGVDRPMLNGDWTAHTSGEYQIQAKPLVSWVHSTFGLERTWEVLQQILLSTGSASYLTAGLNGTTVDASTFFADDMSTWGLGIPHELVQAPADMQQVFAESDPDGDADGALQQVRYVY